MTQGNGLEPDVRTERSTDGTVLVIRRSVHFPVDPAWSEEHPASGYYGTSVGSAEVYTWRDGTDILEQYSILVSSDTGGKIFRRRSRDNGQTWSAPWLHFAPLHTPDGVLRLGACSFFLCPNTGRLLFFYNYHLYPDVHFSGAIERYTRLMIQYSSDGGESFSKPESIVQKGYEPDHCVDGVFYGKNSIRICFCTPLALSDGRILLPAIRMPLGSDFENPFGILWEVTNLIGTWRGERLEWDLAQPVRLRPEQSTRGIDEPAVAELQDGSLLMVCRASNWGPPWGVPEIPGYKWASVSRDGGYTWSEPEPWRYADGSSFYSPAAGSRFIRDARSKKLYWIGNICPLNPEGNSPRHPLVLCLVDEVARAIRKECVWIIDDRRPSDSPFV
jgi:hypothetical protein